MLGGQLVGLPQRMNRKDLVDNPISNQPKTRVGENNPTSLEKEALPEKVQRKTTANITFKRIDPANEG